MLSLLSPGETCETEASDIVETPNSPVFSSVIFEMSEMFIVVRIVDWRRVSVCRSDLVEVFGLITCGVRGIGLVAKLPAARAEVRLTCAFGSGRVRQGRCRRQSREGGLEVTVREQQGRRMKHENGEGEMEKYDMRTANTLRACHVRTPRKENVSEMCVRHGVCVHSPSHTR